MVSQDGAVWCGAVDLQGALYSAVGVHQHDMHGAPEESARVIVLGADCQVGYAVTVKVAQKCHGRPKVIIVGQDGAVWCQIVDLRGALYGAVGVHQHDMHGAPSNAARTVTSSADCQVGYAVAVKVAHSCH